MPEGRPRPRLHTWPVALMALAALVALLLLWGQPFYRFVADQARVRAWVERLGFWGPAGIAALELVQTLAAPIPGMAIEAASGYLFGPWPGALYAMVGIVAGSGLNFFLARRFGRPLLGRWLAPPSLARLDDLVRRGGSLFFFLLWLFPLVPDDLVCLAAGLTSMPSGRFLLLMTVGRLPGILISTWMGASTARLSPGGWAGLLIALALAAVVLWRRGARFQEALAGFLARLSRWVGP